MKPNLLVLSTSATPASKSRVAAQFLLAHLRQKPACTEFVDISQLPPVWVDGQGLAHAGRAWVEIGEVVERADAVVFAAPIYCYTVGSPARVAVELLSAKLAGKPIGLLTAAGSPRSNLAHRDFLSSISDEVHAQILPQPVQITGADFDAEGHISMEICRRLEGLGDLVFEAACARISSRTRQAEKAAV